MQKYFCKEIINCERQYNIIFVAYISVVNEKHSTTSHILHVQQQMTSQLFFGQTATAVSLVFIYA